MYKVDSINSNNIDQFAGVHPSASAAQFVDKVPQKKQSDSVEISNNTEKIHTYDPAQFIKHAKQRFFNSLSDEHKEIFNSVEEKMGSLFPEFKDEFVKTALSSHEALKEDFLSSMDEITKHPAPHPDDFKEDIVGGFGAPELPAVSETEEQSENDEISETPQEVEDVSGSLSSGFSVSMNFELFYSLSRQFSETNMIEDGKQFHRSFSEVIEKFSSSFSLNVQMQGAFLGGTQQLMDLAPETAGDFFAAIDGLAAMDDDSLQTFLETSDAFFNELDEQFGDADGDAFDQISELIRTQVTKFVGTVNSLTESLEIPHDLSNIISDMPFDEQGSIAAAEDLYDSGNEQAAQNLVDLLINDSDVSNMNALLLNNLGALLTKMGDNEKAEEYLSQAIELDPEFAEGYSNLSVAQMLQGEFESALENINSAIEIQPENFSHHHNLGRIYQLMGDNDQALDAYNKALELNPESEKTQEYISEIEDSEETSIDDVYQIVA